VVNRALGGTRSARVAAQTHAGDGVGQRDYALLEVEGGTGSIPSLSLRTQPQRLEAVIAAGYPGLIVKQDEAFKRLIRGDPEAVPALILRSGEILVTQALPSGAQVVAHTAQVLHGNSGGPLTDRCGRAVGVVTFARFEADGTRGVDYAFSGADLVPFLQQNGVRPSISDGPCPAEPAKQPASAESSAAPTENSGG
jgi:S1-C subfamily serine protease